MTGKRLCFLGLALAFVGLVIFVVLTILFQSAPQPTEEERKQMDILSGQRFFFQDRCAETYAEARTETVTIKKARSIAEFDAQHEAIPYLRLVSNLFERYDWPKDRLVAVFNVPMGVMVTWPLPPEAEQAQAKGIWSFPHQAVIYTNDMRIEVIPDDYEADKERRGVPREKWH